MVLMSKYSSLYFNNTLFIRQYNDWMRHMRVLEADQVQIWIWLTTQNLFDSNDERKANAEHALRLGRSSF